MRQLLMSTHGVDVIEVPTPNVKPGHVLVRVRKSLISTGTELAAIRADAKISDSMAQNVVRSINEGKALLGKAIRHPDKAARRLKIEFNRRVMQNISQESINRFSGWHIGYSLAGDVVSIGEGISDLSAGDLVSCAGANCAHHADYVSVPRNLVVKAPNAIDIRHAAFGTVAGIAMQSVRRAAPELDSVVGVIGLGLIGQIVSQLLVSNGCRVIGFDLDEERSSRAPAAATNVSSEEAFSEAIDAETHGHGVDVVLVCAATSSSDPINLAMAVSRRRGRVVIVGDIGLSVDRTAFYQKEIDLVMSTSYGPGRYDRSYEADGVDYPYPYVRWTLNRNIDACLRMMTDGRLDVGALIDEEVQMANAPEVYSRLSAKTSRQPIAVILDFEANRNEAFSSTVSITHSRKKNDATLNVGLVGVGAFGVSTLLPALLEMDSNINLAAIVSNDPLRSGNFAHENDVEVLSSSLNDAVQKVNLDMVLIVNRHDQHADNVVSALQSGANVFCEKPLAVSWEGLSNVVQCHRERAGKSLLVVGFNRRYAPAIEILKSILEQRKSPMILQYRVNAGYVPTDHWLQTREGGGRNIGEACHMYDVFRYLTDCQATSVDASSISPQGERYLRSDNFSATIKYEDGSCGILTYSSMGPKQGMSKEFLEIFVDGEAYTLDDYTELKRASDGKILWRETVPDKGHKNEMRNWVNAVRGKEHTLASVEEVFETTALSLAIEDLIHDRFDI